VQPPRLRTGTPLTKHVRVRRTVQHRAAARARGIPFLLVPSLRARDVLLALVPLLLERQLLRPLTRADAAPAPLTLTRRCDGGHSSGSIGGDSSSTCGSSDGTGTAVARGTDCAMPALPLLLSRHDAGGGGTRDCDSTSTRVSSSPAGNAGSAHAMPLPARVAELQARVLSGELPLHALLAECLGERDRVL
jgi:hypothetical protein